MMSDKDGGLAFPIVLQARVYGKGMSLRDYFAAKALSAMDLQIGIAEPAAKIMAKSAYIVADAMLTQRDQSDE